MTVRIGLIGAQGKMGTRIASLIAEDSRFSLEWGCNSERIFSHTPGQVDVILDFSLPEALEANLRLALEHKTPLVIGVTGFKEEEASRIAEASRHIPILRSPNFSLGIAALAYATEILSGLLKNEFTPYITETHHRHKKDSPSGTALALAQAVREGSGQLPPIQSIRAGEIVGEHTVLFFGKSEKLTLSHEALSKDAFAQGALEAARFLTTQSPGLYGMKDLLKRSID